VVPDEAIKHVVLLMMENHSFDQMLGCLQKEYPELDGVDINSQSPRFLPPSLQRLPSCQKKDASE
jgi:phospholipase C